MDPNTDFLLESDGWVWTGGQRVARLGLDRKSNLFSLTVIMTEVTVVSNSIDGSNSDSSNSDSSK